ncbi:MAG: hypothetical protein AAF363_05860 [Bacteroidota bacterium]
MKTLPLILFSLATVLIFIYSCSSDKKPTVVYPEDSTDQLAEQQLVKDTTLILTAELPIHFDSTDYLLFPIGPVQVYSRGGNKIYSSSGSSGGKSFSIGYLSGKSFTGNMDNVIIQHLDSSDLRPLTTQTLKIRSFGFLESIRKSTGLELIILNITDRDTNRDGKLTSEDIESLYVSHLSGYNFKKLSTDFQELLDWKIIDANKRLYFRTLEDIDRNGEFNKKDKIHHFYVELENQEFDVIKYDPVR